MVGRSVLVVFALAACTGKSGDDSASDLDTSSLDTSGSDTQDSAEDSGDSGADTGDTSEDTGDSGADSEDTADTDTGADTGDTGTDTGSDSGTDTGSDTGTDTDTGSGSDCLVYTAEMRNGSGACTATNKCLIIDPSLTAAGVVSNTCSTSVSIITPTTCLVGSWTLVSASGTASSLSLACGDAITTWAVPAGGSVEEAEAWGPLSGDSYTLSVTFDDAGKETASYAFDVYGF